MSTLPNSEKWNYFFQRRITKNLPVNDEKFCRKVVVAVKHFSMFREHAPSKKMYNSHFYEFGAGWDLIIPLTYYALGIAHQTLVDIRPNLRYDLVNDSVRKFLKNKKNLERITLRPLRRVNYSVNSKVDLFNYYGIDYRAPCDARNTQLPKDSFDFICSTATLAHIPLPHLLEIMKECYRILKPSGIISLDIDLKDCYSYFDKTITYYNFLKFSEPTWSFINSALHFQNRLRSPDYIKTAQTSGFEVLDLEIDLPDSRDIKILKTMKLSRDFKTRYTFEQLGIKRLHIILTKSMKDMQA